MRKILIPLLLGTVSTAALADDHLYGGFQAGLTGSNSTEIEKTTTGLDLEDDKKMGGMLGLYFGKAMGRWRVEGEMAVRKNRFDDIEVMNGGDMGLPLGERDASGNIKSTALMANAWYQLAGNDNWKLFAGLGLGAANIDVNNFRNGPNRLIINDNGWTPAGQGMVQLIKEFEGGLELGVGARHFRTFDNSLTTTDGNAAYAVRNNEVFVRLGWKFGADEPKRAEPAPMARPEPKPQPVMTPVVKEEPKPEPKPVALPGPFMVFFDFDKSTITPDAARIISEAAKAFKEHKVVRLVATGHADRAGTDAYNMRLSQRRADAVKAALVAEGVDADAIMTAAKGESDPLVPTGDGVREPQNRRAEIVLKR